MLFLHHSRDVSLSIENVKGLQFFKRFFFLFCRHKEYLQDIEMTGESIERLTGI